MHVQGTYFKTFTGLFQDTKTLFKIITITILPKLTKKRCDMKLTSLFFSINQPLFKTLPNFYLDNS